MNSIKLLRSISLRKMQLLSLPRCFSSDIYTPDYLEYMKPKIPLYDMVNIQVRGHDYPVLEKYQRLIHNIAKNMDIEVEDGWAVPPQDMKITTLKPLSEVVNSIYNLKTFERSIQITDVPTIQLPVLLRLLETCCPPGVQLNVLPHEEYHDEVRYIPDKELLTLKNELDEMGGPRKVK